MFERALIALRGTGIVGPPLPWLLMVARNAAIRAMDAVRQELMGRCLGRDDAIELVRSALVSIGVVDTWRFRAGARGPQRSSERSSRCLPQARSRGLLRPFGMPKYGYVDLWGP